MPGPPAIVSVCCVVSAICASQVLRGGSKSYCRDFSQVVDVLCGGIDSSIEEEARDVVEAGTVLNLLATD